MDGHNCEYCGEEMFLEEVRTYYGTVDYEWVCINENCKSHHIDE